MDGRIYAFGERRINRKRLRKNSTSSKEKNSEGAKILKPLMKMEHYSGQKGTPVVHIFDDHNSGVKRNLNPE